MPYKALGSLYSQLTKLGADRMGDEDYRDDGSVSVLITEDRDRESDFTTLVSDLTAGEVVPVRLDAPA